MAIPEMPPTQQAVVGTADGKLAYTASAPVGTLTDADAMLVRAACNSVNPVDTKMVGGYCTPGAIAGCDFSGVVLRVHPQATHSFKPGDRVTAAIMGMNPREPAVGAFAEYVVAPAGLTLKVPERLGMEIAAAMPTAFMTAGLALFKHLALPNDPARPATAEKKKTPVLVYGGSTTTGTAATQLLRAAGYEPIVTCSPGNAGLVEKYGAARWFDYRSETCGADIKAATRGNLKYALDCISSTDSMKICYAALGRAGGRYTSLDPFPEHIAAGRKTVKADWVLGPVMLGKEIGWPEPHYRRASAEMRAFGVYWRDVLQALLDSGRIVNHPVEVVDGGFDKTLEALDMVRSKKISGKKLVVRLPSQ